MPKIATAKNTRVVRQPIGTNHFQLRDHQLRRGGGGAEADDVGGIGGGGGVASMRDCRTIGNSRNIDRVKKNLPHAVGKIDIKISPKKQ